METYLFIYFYTEIHPPETELKKENKNNTETAFLDINKTCLPGSKHPQRRIPKSI